MAMTNTEQNSKAYLSNESITVLYHNLANSSKKNMSIRLNIISAVFLGKPYILGSLGEGEKGYFDEKSLYHTDGFDCETFVTTVLALSFAENNEEYQICLQKLRYKDGQVSFINRNHFTGLDWNGNNQKQGFVKDITKFIKNNKNQTIYKMAVAVVDKPSWYQHFTAKTIRLTSSDPQEVSKRLQELKQSGSKLPIQNEIIPYLPLSVLFDKHGSPNHYLFTQIPDGSIIEIIRPNWGLTKEIGTHLNVSHLGFAFWKNNQLIFRHASATEGQVVDVSLIGYLKAALNSPTIKGINIQVVATEQLKPSLCKIKSDNINR